MIKTKTAIISTIQIGAGIVYLAWLIYGLSHFLGQYTTGLFAILSPASLPAYLLFVGGFGLIYDKKWHWGFTIAGWFLLIGALFLVFS